MMSNNHKSLKIWQAEKQIKNQRKTCKNCLKIFMLRLKRSRLKNISIVLNLLSIHSLVYQKRKDKNIENKAFKVKK